MGKENEENGITYHLMQQNALHRKGGKTIYQYTNRCITYYIFNYVYSNQVEKQMMRLKKFKILHNTHVQNKNKIKRHITLESLEKKQTNKQ